MRSIGLAALVLAFIAVAAQMVAAQYGYGYSTTVPPTSGGNYSYPSQSGYGTGGIGGGAILWALLLIMIIMTAYLIMRMSGMGAKLIVIGVFFILAGTAIWLYGGYGGGMAYIGGGVAAILIGTIVWLVGDYKGGVFMMKKK